jgi:sulfatase maturation enzyme AslB (radical SAM superfamily)
MKYLNKEIVILKNRSEYTTVDWILGNYCNFKCSYCFGDLNTGTFRVPKLNDQIKNNILHLATQLNSIGKDKLFFNLAGGEPTMYHDFSQLTSYLKTFGKVGVITNASRTIDWWSNNYHTLDKVIISHHMEFASIEHTMSVIDILLDKVDLSVHVMIHDEKFDESIEAYKLLHEKYQGREMHLEVKLLRSVPTRVVFYNDFQKQEINSLDFKVVVSNENPIHKHSVLVLTNGEKVIFKYHHVKDLTGTFENYVCQAPQEFLQINQYGNIGKMSCGQSYTTDTNIFADDFVEKFTVPVQGVICKKTSCGCMGLLVSSKSKEL